MKKNILLLARLFRTSQWPKNAIVFIPVIFAGKLFDPTLFWYSFVTFVIYCLLSSGLYIINDIFDAPDDRKHPHKKYRPVASGEVSPQVASTLSLGLIVTGLGASIFFSNGLFVISLVYISLHILYTKVFKKYAVIDIFAISFSFMLRAFAGVTITGFHVPVWLMLTIFFMSLFIAAIKRNAELTISGFEARSALARYNKGFLDFLTYTFATATVIAYSLYTYYYSFERVLVGEEATKSPFKILVSNFAPEFGDRSFKYMTFTIPIVVFAVARYAQLFYTRSSGERPEKIIVSDYPLIFAMAIWAVAIISFIYLF